MFAAVQFAMKTAINLHTKSRRYIVDSTHSPPYQSTGRDFDIQEIDHLGLNDQTRHGRGLGQS